MRLIFLALLVGNVLWRLFRRHCWLRCRRHQSAWTWGPKPGTEARVCVRCDRPIFPFVRRAR